MIFKVPSNPYHSMINEALEIIFDYCRLNCCSHSSCKQSFLYREVVFSIHSLATVDIKKDVV